MITHCPSCHTHFRAHAEQLAARAGQVRCGKCGGVFNALEQLVEKTAPAYLAPPEQESAAVRAVTGAEETRIGSTAAETPDDAAESAQHVNAAAAPPAAAGRFGFGPVEAAGSGRRARRWPWVLGALLMLASLLAQTVYYYRGAVILLFPETKPYAAALCVKLGCELPLPSRIDWMSIEASDLQADTTNTNVMVLTATVKNRAIFNQQHPFLELTLTDSQDQPLVRRVLTPRDYVGKSFNAQAGVAANSEIAIKVVLEGAQVKATGYRLYLFYP